MSYKQILLFLFLAALGFGVGTVLEPSARPIQDVLETLETTDGTKIACITGDESDQDVRFLKVATGRKYGTELKVKIGRPFLSGDGGFFFNLNPQREMEIFRVKKGKLVSKYPLGAKSGAWIHRFYSSFDGKLLAYSVLEDESAGWIFRVIEAKSGRVKLELPADDPELLSLVFSQDNKKVAFCYGQRDRLQVWSLGSKPKKLLQKDSVAWVDGARDNSWFVFSQYSPSGVFFHEFGSYREVGSLTKLDEHEGYLQASSDGSRVLTFGDESVRVWDLKSQRVLTTLDASDDAIMSPDGTVVSQTWLGDDGGDVKVSLLCVATGRELLTLDLPEASQPIAIDNGRRKGKVWVEDFYNNTLTSFDYKGPSEK